MKNKKIKGRKPVKNVLTLSREAQYRALLENIPQKLFLKDKKSVYISCNENYARDLKVKAGEVAGKTDYDFFPVHLAEKYRADDKRIMRSGKTENIEEKYAVISDFLKNPKEMTVNTIKAPVRDRYGKVVGILGIFWNATESKEAEEALRISERKMRAIFDQTFQFIGMMTTDGMLIEANRTAMQFAGVNESDCLGKLFWNTPWWTHSKDMQDKLREAVTKAAGGETVIFEATHLDANRKIHYIDFSLKPVKDAYGKTIFLLPEGRDITERKKSEDIINELHKRTEFILGATKTGLDIIDSNFNMVYIDPEWQKVYGDPTGRKCYEYFMGKNEVCPGCGVKKAFETRKPVITEEVLARESNRPVQVTTIPFQDKYGKWLVAEVNVDITERKRYEKELEKYRDHLEDLVEEKTEEVRESEARFKTLFEDARDCILLVEIDTRRFSMFNMMACSTLGYTGEEMKRLNVNDIHPAEDLPRVLDVFEKLALGKFRTAESIPVKRKDGSVFYADIAVSIITLSGKRYLMGNFRDITERKKTEEKLQESEASYRAIFESANDAIVIRDINTFKILDANKKACEMFCYPKEEIIGLPLGSLSAGSVQYPLKKLKSLYEEASKGNPQLFEWSAMDKFGREFWIEINVKKAIIAGQYRLLYIARDATERRQLWEQKDSFINMVTHELKAPLVSIKESIALVSEGRAGPVDEKKIEILDIAKKNIDRLNRLINAVLDLQKIDIGKLELKWEENNINEIINEAYDEMSPLAAKKSLNIILKLDDKIPSIKLDRDKILQVLINIINNAIKFTEKGDITITSAQEDSHIRISVQDTGPGIRAQDIPKLFQRFSQLERKPGGTGLGLAISKEMIRLHGGEIGVESDCGKGATFYFTLNL